MLGKLDLSTKYPLINDVYESSVKMLDEEDKDIAEKKRVITDQIKNYENKMKNIRDNAKTVTGEIQTMLSNALKSAMKQIDSKTAQLLSDKTDL